MRFNNNTVFFFALLVSASAAAQTFTVTRNSSVYIPNKKLTPATIIDGSFDTVSKRQYVIAEGYINYIASFPKAEADGDFHFEMQSAKNIRKVGNADPNGFVCEIDPVLQLTGLAALQQIKRNDPNTFRKVRVYGWLRYGTEATHSGVRRLNAMNATLLKALVALLPACMLFCGSVLLFFRGKTVSSSLQLIGAGCLVVVVLTHVSEALHLFPSMHWGHRHSIGHYLDFWGAVLGITLFPLGYLFHALTARHA